MTTQYLRQASLIVGSASGAGLDLSQLQFTFTTQRGDATATPNTAKITVYNPSATTATQIFGGDTPQFTRVILQCGYYGLTGEQPYIGTIFDGSIKYVRRGRENPTDTYVEIVAADGDSAYNYAVINTSLAAGSTANDHINQYLKNMVGVQTTISGGYIPVFETAALPRGKVMFGLCRDELRNTATSVNAAWSIQDGQLQLVPFDGQIPGEAIVVNYATGMIGLPEKTQSGIFVKTLLNPKIKIGTILQLNNNSIQDFNFSVLPQNNILLQSGQISTNTDGLYRVLWVEHSGDTRGNEWYSDIICVDINSGLAPTNISRTAAAAANDERVDLPPPQAQQ